MNTQIFLKFSGYFQAGNPIVMNKTLTSRAALIFTGFFFFIFSSFAQYSVEGQIVAEEPNNPLVYANVALHLAGDSSLVKGAITDEDGKFRFDTEAGSYFVKISFLGFETYFSETFTLDSNQPHFILPPIQLTTASTTLDEVEIEGQKSTMTLGLDKRVFNVGQDLANTGANASEILSNIPSVTVDPEGNVKLRGNPDVRILIDGKPSGLVNVKGGAGLKQLQGSLIESVEVITNPSAR
ncbi:MAG: carboxypeptidase regulatory-like domain-containing protein [Bacteroidia bacterium]